MIEKEGSEGFRVADESGIPVPSRLQLVEFITSQMTPVALDDICQYFYLKGKPAKQALESRLKRLQNQGVLLMDRKGRYGLTEKMDMIIGRVSGHANGYGFVISDQGGEDLYLHHKEMRKVLHGDRVLARTKRIDHQGRKEGAIVEVLIDESREVIGHYHHESGVGFVEPDDTRFARDISIPKDRRNGAKEGDIVVAKIIGHPTQHHHAVGEVTEVLGKVMEPGMETQIAIKKFEIPSNWPDAVNEQTEKMLSKWQRIELDKGRKDLRSKRLVTIDGIDARDFDDAVYCEPNENGWQLLVAIADVSHYVIPGTALDDEALSRGNSVYFPNQVIPMLPEALSNGICSLNPHEDRYCMVCDMQINQQGEVVEYQFYPGVMYSHARLTYEIVDAIVNKRDPEQRQAWQEVTPHLDSLYQLYRCLDKKRRQRGTVDFEFPEPFIQFDSQQRISQISVRSRNNAHKMIEECMLAANVCAAEFLKENIEGDVIYRNHQGPEVDALTDLRRFLSGLGLTLDGGDEPRAKDYAKLVSQVSDRPEVSPIVQSVLLRSLGQAVYSIDEEGHFALAYSIYTHFTSPIRRYSDLIVHRQIKSMIAKKNKSSAVISDTNIAQIADHCSYTERRAEDATRDVISWLKAQYMQDKVGEEFSGVISSVKEFGVFVQLDDIFVDGLVHVTALGNDYYHFDPIRFQLTGERSAKRFRLGDAIKVIVVRVDLMDSKIDFELAEQVERENRKKPISNKGKKEHKSKTDKSTRSKHGKQKKQKRK